MLVVDAVKRHVAHSWASGASTYLLSVPSPREGCMRIRQGRANVRTPKLYISLFAEDHGQNPAQTRWNLGRRRGVSGYHHVSSPVCPKMVPISWLNCSGSADLIVKDPSYPGRFDFVLEIAGTYYLYRLKNGQATRVCEYKPRRSREYTAVAPSQIVHARHDDKIVAGSGHGIVYVFDRDTAQVVAELGHPSLDVHNVAVNRKSTVTRHTLNSHIFQVSRHNDRLIIASASPVSEGTFSISLWEYRAAQSHRQWTCSIMNWLNFLIWGVVVVLAVLGAATMIPSYWLAQFSVLGGMEAHLLHRYYLW